MLNRNFAQFKGQRILLLQGPVGPFFARLARDLRAAGATVFKINFHLGDRLFYPRGALDYRGTMEDWPAWIDDKLGELDIDSVLLFGDCRPLHAAAHDAASRRGIEVGVFEEGYVRPDYVTLERTGVNGFSRLPRNPDFYRRTHHAIPARRTLGSTYWAMVGWGFLYFTVGALGRPLYPHYRHHRPLQLREMFPWLRSWWRKLVYRYAERGLQARLAGVERRRYYLVPLQVHNDAQLAVHAEFEGMADFIGVALASFAAHAPEDTLLVFKHHPLDRGYSDYTRLIAAESRRLGVVDRVLYLHDQHLPTLLRKARGVVVVNSTVGLSALGHHAPTKVCGDAIYDIDGLTYQGTLDAFWADAGPATRPDPELLRHFRAHLIERTQLNGSFYKRLSGTGNATGMVWGDASAADADIDWRLVERRLTPERARPAAQERRSALRLKTPGI